MAVCLQKKNHGFSSGFGVDFIFMPKSHPTFYIDTYSSTVGRLMKAVEDNQSFAFPDLTNDIVDMKMVNRDGTPLGDH
jgi:hypothetical protein